MLADNIYYLGKYFEL